MHSLKPFKLGAGTKSRSVGAKEEKRITNNRTRVDVFIHAQIEHLSSFTYIFICVCTINAQYSYSRQVHLIVYWNTFSSRGHQHYIRILNIFLN